MKSLDRSHTRSMRAHPCSTQGRSPSRPRSCRTSSTTRQLPVGAELELRSHRSPCNEVRYVRHQRALISLAALQLLVDGRELCLQSLAALSLQVRPSQPASNMISVRTPLTRTVLDLRAANLLCELLLELTDGLGDGVVRLLLSRTRGRRRACSLVSQRLQPRQLLSDGRRLVELHQAARLAGQLVELTRILGPESTSVSTRYSEAEAGDRRTRRPWQRLAPWSGSPPAAGHRAWRS